MSSYMTEDMLLEFLHFRLACPFPQHVSCLQLRSSWSNHSQISGMLGCIQLLKVASPRVAVIENVMGFKMLHAGSNQTPLQFFKDKIT